MQTIEILPEKARNGVVIGPKYEAIALMHENGFTTTKMGQALGMSRERVSTIKNQIIPKYDLRSRKYVKLASDVIKQTLQGKTIGDVQTIKDSTVLQAA